MILPGRILDMMFGGIFGMMDAYEESPSGSCGDLYPCGYCARLASCHASRRFVRGYPDSGVGFGRRFGRRTCLGVVECPSFARVMFYERTIIRRTPCSHRNAQQECRTRQSMGNELDEASLAHPIYVSGINALIWLVTSGRHCAFVVAGRRRSGWR